MIKNLLDNIADKVTRFITRKWIKVHDQSGETCNTSKQVRFKTSMLRSDLFDFSDTYIVVKGIVTVSADEKDRDEMNREVILKNNTPFISCVSKINGVIVENSEGLDTVMPMYNLLKLYIGDCKNGDFPESATFKIKDYKLYVPVVTLSAENDNKLLEQLKTGFKEQLNGINIDQKCLIRVKITI